MYCVQSLISIYSYVSGIVDVSITSTGTDGWRGEFVHILLTNKEVKCKVPNWLDDKKTIQLLCSTVSSKGMYIRVEHGTYFTF